MAILAILSALLAGLACGETESPTDDTPRATASGRATEPAPGGEDENYIERVDRAMTALFDDTADCQVEQEQSCLTEAFRRAVAGVGESAPPETGWITLEHERLEAALNVMLDIHLRSETELPSEEFANESVAAVQEFQAAATAWADAAARPR